MVDFKRFATKRLVTAFCLQAMFRGTIFGTQDNSTPYVLVSYLFVYSFSLHLFIFLCAIKFFAYLFLRFLFLIQC